MPFTAYAQQNASKDWGDQFITHAELEDKNGNPKTDFYINDTMKANWDFNIPSNTPIKAGDTMTVKIPSPLQVQGVVEFDIIDSSGKVIWHAKTNPDGTVTITFNEEAQAEAAGGIKGSFNIYTHWDNSKAKTNDVVPIDWGTGGKSTINPHDAENPTIPVNPVGPDNSYESENATINSFNDEQNSNGKIDTLPATDQQKATSIIIVGVGLLIITGILFWFVKKRD